MHHYLKKILYFTGITIFILVSCCVYYVVFQGPKNWIEHQKYEDHLNMISKDIIKILQWDPEIHWISANGLTDEHNHYCGLEGSESTCVQKFQLIQVKIAQIPSGVRFYRCHFSKGDVFIRQRRHYIAPWEHKYELFVPFAWENPTNLTWIEYDQNRDVWYDNECYPWDAL